jgi:hypothetical protein
LFGRQIAWFGTLEDFVHVRRGAYTQQFRRLVGEARMEVIRLPPMSPNLIAYSKRFVRSIKG